MRRNNLFISKFKGGLSLVNLEVKLKVHRFLLFRDKTTAVIAGVLKTLAGRYLDPWLVMSQEDAPIRTPELRYYREI